MRLLIAQLIPFAIKALKKAFRKRKQPAEPNANLTQTPPLETPNDRQN